MLDTPGATQETPLPADGSATVQNDDDQRTEDEALLAAWQLADRAYQLHHFACGYCIAAGRDSRQRRCPVGAVLWEAYENAGFPPLLNGPGA